MPDKKVSIRVPDTLRKVGNLIPIFSAKGGVGKSEIALNLALSLANKKKKVGLADVDIYGPSQTTMMGTISEEIEVSNKLLNPVTKNGIKLMSMGLINDERKPIIWRGPMVSGAVVQLLTQTDWKELDYLIIDTPPGTGDVQLTLLQRIPITSSIIVTTPQKVAISDTKKGIEMINKLGVPILGLIENMSWYQPDNSNTRYYPFGKDGGVKLANEYSLDLLSQIPLYENDDLSFISRHKATAGIFDALGDKVITKIQNIKRKKNETIPHIDVTND